MPRFNKVENRILREGRRVKVGLYVMDSYPDRILHKYVDDIVKKLQQSDDLRELRAVIKAVDRRFSTHAEVKYLSLVQEFVQKFSALKTIANVGFSATSYSQGTVHMGRTGFIPSSPALFNNSLYKEDMPVMNGNSSGSGYLDPRLASNSPWPMRTFEEKR